MDFFLLFSHSLSLQLCEMALSHGYLPAVFNRRSHNGTPLTTLKLQQFGDPADLREAVRYIRYRQPAGRLYAVSESTGSGLLLSYLGECGSSSYVTAAVCLSPVFRCQSWFENGLYWPLQWALVLYQKISLSRYGGRETCCWHRLYVDRWVGKMVMILGNKIPLVKCMIKQRKKQG